MSDVQNTTSAAAAETTPAVESSTTTQQPQTTVEETPKTDAPATTETPAAESSKPVDSEETPVVKDEAAAEEKKKDEAAAVPEKKPVEPITEGQLAVKGPGLLKSIIPSKKEFWLSDEPVSPQALNSYMRGEKPEIAHPVVAWASQTGKGLLFFNKKGETNKKSPSHVLPLYDAADLKKESPHELSFKLHGQEHVLKATTDAERDGWYLSIEKAIEIGKSQKEEIRESEGYKAEMEKLNKPAFTAAAAVPAKPQPTKTTEADKTDDAAAAADAERKNSDIAEDDKKDKKSRSTSRGVLGRLKGKKEEAEAKKEEKKEEKKTEEEPKSEENKTEEIAAGSAVAGTAAVGAAAVAGSSEEDKKEETTAAPAENKTEEKSKPAKRGSIFGKMQGWGSVKSPSKEKEQKDAELKPEVPPKDTAVAETAPQIPETTTTEPAEEAAPAPVVATEGETKTDAKPETAEKKEGTTPGKEKSAFLSGLPFMNKRNRSVSPSANMKEAPAKTEEAAPAEVPKEAEPVEEGKTDEAIAETTGVEPLKPEEAAKADTTPNKRQSVLGNLGRRASKAFKGMQAPKRENAAPSTEAKKEETVDAAKTTEAPTTNGESKSAEPAPASIGDVVPEAIAVGKPENQAPAVAASA